MANTSPSAKYTPKNSNASAAKAAAVQKWVSTGLARQAQERRYINAGSVAQPFLTPAEQQMKIGTDAKYANAIADLNARLSQAPITEKQSEADNIHSAAVNSKTAAAVNAARGVFNSSINQNDMSDIATKLALANNTLHTNLATLTSALQGQINQQTINQGIDDAGFNQQAVTNAQGVPPVVVTPASTAAATAKPKSNNATGGNVNNKKVAQSKMPVPVSVTNQPRSTHATGKNSSPSGSFSSNMKFPASMGQF